MQLGPVSALFFPHKSASDNFFQGSMTRVKKKVEKKFCLLCKKCFVVVWKTCSCCYCCQDGLNKNII